ncbi:MAG: protein-disulfide reductase DsbD family protein [Bdellovibrionota bacterium]
MRITGKTFLLKIFLLFCTLPSWALRSTEKFKSERTQVDVISSIDTISPETRSFYLALNFDLTPHWHIYWKNTGDSGTPPSVNLIDAPSAVESSSIIWPAPHRIPLEPLMSYGYEGQVVLPLQIQLEKEFTTPLKLKLRAEWLVCKVECIPENQDFTITLNSNESEMLSGESALIQKALSQVPQIVPGINSSYIQDKNSFVMRFESQASGLFENLSEAYFYSSEGLRVTHAASQNLEIQTPKTLILTIQRDENDDDTKNQLEGVLELTKADGTRLSLELVAKQTTSTPFSWKTFLISLLFSFLGGLILNLMPCVFPVLFLKLYSLSKNNTLAAAQKKLQAWAYGAGVISSFLLLATLLLLLKKSGIAVGWGFQLQNSSFIFFAFLLFVALALSLLGVYEISGAFTGAGQSLTEKSGTKGSFFTGVLATLVATPCSAPFMGSAVGYALTRQSWEAFPIFFLLGAGLAFPFILLAYIPSLVSWIPKPGQWMDHLKQFFGFTLLGTSLWLLWVLSTQQNIESIFYALTAAFALSIALWSLRLGYRPLKYLILFLCAWAMQSSFRSTLNENKQNTTSSQKSSWESFNPETLQGYIQNNKAVFIDFTASWCLSCQVNKKLVLNTSEADAFFKENNIVRMRADWTHYDPIITRALSELGRQSVPVYAYYGPGQSKATLLPELLNMNVLKSTIEKVNKEKNE